MSLGEKLMEEMTPKTMFSFNLFGAKIPVTDTVVTMWIIMAALVIFVLIITRKMKQVPTTRRQHLAEAIVNFINNMSKNNIGHEWRRFAPYLGSVALFLLVANIISIFSFVPDWKWLYEVTGIGIFNKIPEFRISPPTRDINVTAAMAIMSITVVLIGGIVVKGPVKWFKSFFEPNPIIFPFKIMDYFIRPTSLCLRLFGNILGAFIIMELLYITFPILAPAALSVYFDLFDGILQAFVFVFLTSFYIAESVEE